MSKKSNKKGCVGFLQGGLIKQNNLVVFCDDNSTPEKVHDDFKELYGDTVVAKYVSVDDQDDVLKSFKKELTSKEAVKLSSKCFASASIDTGVKSLKELTGLKTVHKYPTKSKSGEESADENEEEKPKKKSSSSKKGKDESEKEETEDEKSKKKSSSSKKSKDESEKDKETEEDSKSKKKSSSKNK